jgi:hypothetical protein
VSATLDTKRVRDWRGPPGNRPRRGGRATA